MKHILFFFSCWLFLSTCLFSTAALATPAESTPAKVENPFVIATSAPLTSLSKEEQKAYLSGQHTTWPDGTPVVIVLYPKESPEIKWLCTHVIHLPPITYRRFIMQKAFISGITIIDVQTQEEALTAFSTHKGALGPLTKENIKPPTHALVIE